MPLFAQPHLFVLNPSQLEGSQIIKDLGTTDIKRSGVRRLGNGKIEDDQLFE